MKVYQSGGQRTDLQDEIGAIITQRRAVLGGPMIYRKICEEEYRSEGTGKKYNYVLKRACTR